MDPGKARTKAALESLGYRVTDIPQVKGQRSADLRATKHGSDFIVEVKARTEDVALRKMMEGVRVGKTERTLTSLENKNSLANDIKEANEQLRLIAPKLISV